MFTVGIDVAMQSHRTAVLNNEGEKITSFSFVNTQDGYKQFLSKLAEHSIDKSKCIIGFEATGNHWENLCSFLTQQGFSLKLLNPYQTSGFRKLIGKKAKTDDIDAFVIAGLLRTNEYTSCFIPDDIVVSLRELTKLRRKMQHDLKSYKRRVLSLLNVVFPEFRQTAVRNPFAVASKAILQAFPTAKHLVKTTASEIEKIVRSIKGNNFNVKEIEHMIQTASKSVYSGLAQNTRAVEVKSMLRLIADINESMQALQSEIDRLLSPKDDSTTTFPGQNLLTIPGVGKQTVAALLSITGVQGEAFSNTTKLVGHLGFFPAIFQSGESEYANKISHRGPAYFRWHMYMAAVSCIRHNDQARLLYNRKISQGKSPKQALVYVARKLAMLMLSMLKSGKDYDTTRFFAQPVSQFSKSVCPT